MARVVADAVADARTLAEAGFDALLVENFGDAPFFPREVPPETVAALALVLDAVRRAAGGLPVGVNVLRNDVRAALAIAAATGALFVRVNVHTGAAVADQGLLEGRAHETLRVRAALAPDVLILADLRVKHARPLADLPLELLAEDTVARGLADALIVTGPTTGRPPPLEDLDAARRGGRGAPVLVGSGASAASAPLLAARADGVIVGSALKRGGAIEAPVDAGLARSFAAAWRGE
jgi:membrane complex biogenesis BtpA family protein